ncbi:MAG TPA: DUF2066 domain-containing protein [Methyloceanibacter sp.]|nr:DUF2066 domain-containing protein [Methyloceanibacter sp.]
MSFPQQKPILLLAFLALLGMSCAAAHADSLYDVAKIMVDTTAKDAVAARQMGMAEAEMRAIGIVLKRLVPPSVQPHLPPLSKEDVENMVSGVSIRSEQNSTTRYLATLDVSFNEHAVKQFLIDQGIPYGEERAPSITLLPLVIDGERVQSEGPEGWRQAWEGLDLANSLTPVTILRPRDALDAKTVKAALAGEAQAFAQLQADYGYAPLVIALGEAAGGKFTTQLAGTDAVGQINVTLTDNQSGNAKASAKAAAATALSALEHRWKAQSDGGFPVEARYQEGAVPPEGQEGYDERQSRPGTPGEVARNVVAMVEFSGLKDWQDIRTRLAQVAGIQRLEVNTLSARTASVTFDYAGTLGHLQAELGQNGFSFDDRDGTFVLRSR